MILYCAADPKYFDLYFDLWEKQTSKIYPELRRHIALYNPTDEAKQKCVDHMVDFNDITEWFPENPTRNHFYLLRWLYLPYLYQQNILETQINCLPVREMTLPTKIKGQWRIQRPKPKTTTGLGGVSGAIFTPEAAKKVVDQAVIMLKNPPDTDHEMNMWQMENLPQELEKCEHQIKDKYGIELIMDNCDSLGSKWKGKLLTDYTIASSCSFYPAHHITTGEGGMVSSNNQQIVQEARSFAWWGRDCYCVGSANLLACGTCGNRFDKWLKDYDEIVDHKYIFTNMGYNLKPLDLQGAMGVVQLDKFDEIHERRRNSKNKLQKIIEECVPNVYLPNELEPSETSWFGTPIVCDNKKQKDELVKYFEDIKVQTRNYFAGNILLHPGYSHLDDYSKYPNSNKVLDKVFFIGASPHYDNVIFDYIQTKLQEKYCSER